MDLNDLSKDETSREKQIRVNKRNSNRILHERNIYVFLASVAEDAMNSYTQRYSELSGFLLVKKLLMLIDFLRTNLQFRKNIFNLEQWESFIETKDFKDIFMYISKEYDVFKLYFDQLYATVQANMKKYIGTLFYININ